MKKLFVTCALIMGAILIAPGNVSAQATTLATGAVDVSIDVNGFVILYYYNEVDIEIPANVMVEALTGSSTTDIGSALSASATSGAAGELNISGDALDVGTFQTSQTLTIANAWSVRGLTSAAVTVGISSTMNNLTSTVAGAGSIGVSNGACSGTCSFLPSLGTTHSGGVTLDLDFSSANMATVFDSGATYTITVVAP